MERAILRESLWLFSLSVSFADSSLVRGSHIYKQPPIPGCFPEWAVPFFFYHVRLLWNVSHLISV